MSNRSDNIRGILSRGELPWIKSTSATASGTKKKTRSNNKLPHQLLIDAVKYIDDNYWIDIILDMAHHTYPKKFVIKDGILSYKKNMTSIYSTNLNILNIENVADEIIRFMQQHRNMKSEIDKKNDTIIANNIRQKDRDNLVNNWSTIKSPKQKGAYLRNYAIKLSSESGLNYNDIYALLSTELLLKNILPEHIIIKNSVIRDITSFKYKDGKYYVNIPESKNSVTKRTRRTTANIKRSVYADDKITYIKPCSLLKCWNNNVSSLNNNSGNKSHREIIMETLSEIERESTTTQS